jgi:hypothetical protein
MDADVARAIAHYSHRYERDRFGDLLIEHVSRVAAHVPIPAQATAWLHDVPERSDTRLAALRRRGLTDLEADALDLLTRRDDEGFELYVLRIVHAPGGAGALARAVKLADLDDHIACGAEHSGTPDLPPYLWARRHVSGMLEPTPA